MNTRTLTVHGTAPGGEFSRRSFLKHSILAASLGPARALEGAESESKVALAQAMDEVMEDFMRRRRIPGGSLAITRGGRLVYAKGYGWADQQSRVAVQPDSLFRIASISKPVTAVAILRLVERGQLKLDAPVLSILRLNPLFRDCEVRDRRWERITIRHLLWHVGGWDREKSGDPMFRSREIAEDLKLSPPARAADIIRFQLGRALDFDPGTRYAYSNFGYCLLGRVIEVVSGERYEEFVRERVLTAVGIQGMRLGRSLLGERFSKEVAYHASSVQQVRSVFGRDGQLVPFPDGGFCLEAMDAHGGWLASAVDLVRFGSRLAPEKGEGLLSQESLRLLAERPGPPLWTGADGKPESFYYGLGWMVRPVGKEGRFNLWHNGSLPGTYSLLVKRWDGMDWTVLFNRRSEDRSLDDGEIDGALHQAVGRVREWPEEDLFEKWLKG